MSSAAASRAQFTMPTEAKLRNQGGNGFTLRKHNGDGLRAKGDGYDMREFGDDTVSVGHIFFHPSTRAPPIPPFAELQAFMTANPTYPISVDYNRRDNNPCEDPHIVLAKLELDDKDNVARDTNNSPVIRLFTIAADTQGSRAFDPATHMKNGVQYEGVEIHNWSLVNFDAEYRSDTLQGTFRKIFMDLNLV